MPSVKKQDTPETEKLASIFLKEDGADHGVKKCHWKHVVVPSTIKVHPILSKLRKVKLVIDEFMEEEYDGFKLDLAENNKIETVRKDNVFGEEVTESEMDIIQQRVALQQRQFQEYERREHARKSKKIKTVYDYLTEEEIAEMLIDCSHNEEEAIGRLTEAGYLQRIRREVAMKHTPEEESTSHGMTEEQQVAYQQLLKKRSVTLKKTTNDSAKKQYRMGGRLGLDEAIKQIQGNNIDPEKAFEGWSSARIRAYQMIEQNPNSYYYRFNAPGEVQRKGQWAADERKVFFERLEQVGANGQWGIFAMKVPGRVGYQCSNFYRLLIETNELQDPNYVLDDKGKAHYLFDKKTKDGNTEKTFRTHSKHGTGRGSGIPSSSGAAKPTSVRKSRAAAAPVDKKAKKKKRRRGWNSDSEDDDDDFEDYGDTSGTYTVSSRAGRSSRNTRARMDIDEQEEDSDQDMDNPLPGFLDPITLDEVVKPAISTYGHVMGYDSWVRCLTNWEGKKNICPLTKKPLTKRDLVILTHENIEEYRDRIIQ